MRATSASWPETRTQELDLWDGEVFERGPICLDNTPSSGEVDRKAVTKAFADQLLQADVLVVASPMWNHSVPWPLKRYIDSVIQPGMSVCADRPFPFPSLAVWSKLDSVRFPPGLTFHETATGPEPVRGGRHLVLVTSSGGDYSKGSALEALDFMTPYLRAIFGLVATPTLYSVPAAEERY